MPEAPCLSLPLPNPPPRAGEGAHRHRGDCFDPNGSDPNSGAPAGFRPMVTRQQVLDRIRLLILGFGKRAAAAEAARQLPAESVRELIDAGVIRILMPERFGGYGLGLDTWLDVVLEISRADASHGWCASLLTHHPHFLAQCTEEAQRAVWADGPDVPIAASFFPSARITREAGGFRVSGQSPFASGVGHCSWVFVGGTLDAPQGVEGQRGPNAALFLIPPGEYQVTDVWHTAGMCGTGSNTIVTDNVFVPESRMVRLVDLAEGRAPGGALHAAPIFRAPLISYAPISFAAPMLGAAQGAYEHFREWIKTRKMPGGGSFAEITSIQVRLARTAADLDAAEFLLRRATEVSGAATPPTLALRARSLRDFARVAEFSIQAIDTLLSMCGTAGFATSHPIQRAWRDIHFSAMHISLNPESNYAHFGRMELGLPRDPKQPFF